MRLLSVPTFSDRLVQEPICMILEAIYEENNLNFGFRPDKECHHAIQFIKNNDTWCSIAVAGDIEGAYDNVDQNINTLKKRIVDKKFLNFLKLGFKCGLLNQGERGDTFKNEKKVRNTEYDRLSNLVDSKKRTYKNIKKNKNLSN